MNDKIKRFTFYNIFFLCAFLGLFMVLNLKSFAYKTYSMNTRNGTPLSPNGYTQYEYVFTFDEQARYAIFCSHTSDYEGVPLYTVNMWSNQYGTYDFVTYYDRYDVNGHLIDSGYLNRSMTFTSSDKYYVCNNYIWGNNSISSTIPIFYDFDDLKNYLENGVLPDLPFDETLRLDSFKVTSWQVGTFQATFKSKFLVTWSDERISNVQVRIVGTANSPASFESNSSPFKQKFSAGNYVMKNGDVIHLTATPFKANGEYGESLYYSLVYDDNLPSNWYRKLVNTPYNDTTITIPYNNVSGQPQSVTLPVDGITTNKVYKVNYNPVTYEYGDINIYDIYYNPVIVYPDDTPEEEIDETQDTIINDYTTNNYNTINNITNYEFNIDFGDISNNDIQDSYDDVGNFLNGFGSFIAKIVNFFGVLFPFFPAGVSIAIITAFGIVALLLIVALVIKIVSAIKNFIF